MRKQILVSVDRGETRVAVREAKGSAQRGKGSSKEGSGRSNGFKVGELYVERRGQRSIVGNIYKGVVDNVLPGMEAAFVDIGLERNGFLHVDEIALPGGEAAPKRGRGRGRRIDELIKPKQELLVQVVKDPLKTKGARLSMQLSIAGRYLVYMPQGEGVGVSRRVPDSQRDKLRKLLANVRKRRKGEFDGGLIVRTAAQGAKAEDFEREIGYLLQPARGARAAGLGGRGAGPGLPGGGPLGPGRARRAPERVRGRRDRRRQAASAGDELLPADGP